MTSSQRGAIRLVVALLIASLAVSVVFALLTLLFRHDVLAYQQARRPDADPHTLAMTLWTRPIPVAVVAVLYIWVVRQLLAGAARAFRRVRIVSVAGLVAVGWVLATAEYPPWLRVVQGVQLAVLAALIVAVNRRVVRVAFAVEPDPRPRNRRAALLLVVVAPFVAEVSLGNIPLGQAWVVLFFLPIYGGGALFIREVVRRTGGGLANLLLLGVAYGLVEEGLALQSLTSPHLYGAAGWAPSLFGLNTAYTELNLVYHAVFSITVPVVVVEFLFAAHGTRPYLRRGGLIATGVVALLGAALIRLVVPASEDPGYTMPLLAVLLIAAAAAAVTVLALRIRVGPARAAEPESDDARPAAPPRLPIGAASPRPRIGATAPRVPTVAGAAAVASFGFLALVWPFAGARQPLFTHGAWSLLPMAGAAVVVAATLLTLRRWSAAPDWTPRHLFAACVGAVVGHTLFGLAGNAETPADRAFLLAVAVLTAAAGATALRRTGRTTRVPARS
ncbi:hypothetical protein [Actinoplanes sp. NBRC 103695]|uniref:hypothetical protein n=1 Tax=Actinoplanes sp. NBRC 103695 TaxID=3032202 RepID=UPI0024A26D87|nr:hypothetical protein [Actinoplanes sp. NBRC 103695]GLY97482.1 hypothetical protein Acsp02_47360 [Actinoplanes sp. NBRC 103695]